MEKYAQKVLGFRITCRLKALCNWSLYGKSDGTLKKQIWHILNERHDIFIIKVKDGTVKNADKLNT